MSEKLNTRAQVLASLEKQKKEVLASLDVKQAEVMASLEANEHPTILGDTDPKLLPLVIAVLIIGVVAGVAFAIYNIKKGKFKSSISNSFPERTDQSEHRKSARRFLNKEDPETCKTLTTLKEKMTKIRESVRNSS
mmetsp:Transcript_26203/g.36184  ORF Transcript_26203/g.36184 Transcript_26203/m.36184 type:complete len:136 (-) Transcript_26203:82-489(-)|eukprot:CAMPEP_0196595170 /NCGR_PEP_ID=MMETSP1081-20130531/80373_1 /TAXON_ID=36882 /ORGANISM="Pyramimonas amylifera, Strain CCMP720" /LENGTH=135 /DNA_ID=CAMNT_0041919663 /DNA_START=193 /DNA_END=600 /DNA_ORIENTATION=+